MTQVKYFTQPMGILPRLPSKAHPSSVYEILQDYSFHQQTTVQGTALIHGC